jgi:hypothetical protein
MFQRLNPQIFWVPRRARMGFFFSHRHTQTDTRYLYLIGHRPTEDMKKRSEVRGQRSKKEDMKLISSVNSPIQMEKIVKYLA